MSYNPTPKSLPFERSPKNQEESDRYANALYNDGNYPAGLGGCFTVGISGGCGKDCFVFQNGECKNFAEGFLPDDKYGFSIEELKEIYFDCGYYEKEIEEYFSEHNIPLVREEGMK